MCKYIKKKSKRDIYFLLMNDKALYQFFYIIRTFIWILYCWQGPAMALFLNPKIYFSNIKFIHRALI